MKTTSVLLAPSFLLAGALALCGASAARSQTTVPTPTFTWNFDGGAATDSSGNGHDGVISGNVTKGAGATGDGLTGFTSSTSYVTYNTGITNPLNSDKNETLSLWLKNPGTADRVVILGVGSTGSGNRQVELWLTQSGGQYTLNLGYQNWNGNTQSFASSAFTWGADTWYNLSFVISKAPNNGSDKQLYDFTVYLTAQDAAGLNTTPILSGVVGTGYGTTGPANAPADAGVVYVGANTAGFYNPFKPAGYFGGSIDSVSYWEGMALTADQLNEAFLATQPIPEPAAMAALAGAGVLALAFVVRRRSRR